MRTSGWCAGAALTAALLTGCGGGTTKGEPPPPPRETPAPAPVKDAPKAEAPKTEAPKAEAPKAEAPAAPTTPVAGSGSAPASDAPKSGAPAPAAGFKEVQFSSRSGKFTVSIPEAWESQPAGGMRNFQARVPKAGADSEDAEVVMFHMPAGGGADANISRWAGQMGGDSSLKNKRTTKTANGKEAIIAELEGTYVGMAPGTGAALPAKPGFKMLGAFIPTASGDMYVKLTGPAATVDAQKAAFDRLVETLR